MNSLSTNKTLRLLGCLLGMLGSSAAWTQGVNPHPSIMVPHHDAEAPASSPNLPKLGLTPQLLYQMLLAEIAGARANQPLAARTYLDLARSTRDPRIAKRATEFALYARQPEQALDAARIWAETDSESAQARQMLAGLLLNAQRADEAAIHLAKLLDLDQANLAEALKHLNRLLGRFSDKAVILKLTEQLTVPYVGMAEAHWARAQAAASANEDARALEAIDRALALQPEWEQAVLFKAQVQQRSSTALAVETLRRFSAEHPKAREVRSAYARALLSDKNYEASRREFAKLMEEKPDDPEVLYAVGLLSLQLNDLAPAEKHLKRLLDLGTSDPNPLRYYLGQIAENAKRPEDAMQWYVLVTPGEQFMPARSRMATLLVQQGRLDDARRSLRQAAASNPSLSENERIALLIAEAQLLRDAARFADAFELLSQGLAEHPEQPDLLYEVALLAEKLGKNEVLENNLRRLIKLKPDYAHAYNALGYSLADRGERLDEAQRLIEKALELAPEDPFILDSKGWLLYRRGDRNGSYTFLNRALSLRPDPEIAAHLGEVLWVMGRREEALKTWNDAAKANPSNEVLAATIKKFAP
ncbi:MAG: tetratricopeptide repeat protein [Betaproteobacteria bacterium]|nr:tetratricopeptide repeat protein [Betaproteobacteria bacterium]